MELMGLIREELDTYGKTYRDIATKVNAAVGTVGSWFSRGAIPPDMLGAVVQAIGSPRLVMEYVARIPGNIFATRYLDKVDDHPFTAIDKANRVLNEWDKLADLARETLRNKPKGYQFDSDEDMIIREFEDKTADTITVMQTILVRLEERYDRPVSATMQRHVEKLEARGYCTPGKEKNRFKAAK